MYNSWLSLIANYRACLLHSRYLLDLFSWMCVWVCVVWAFNDGAGCTLFKICLLCAMAWRRRRVGYTVSINTLLGSHSDSDGLSYVCLLLCVTPLQPGELRAITGQQGCHGDQWCHRGATSVGCFCLSRQVFALRGWPFPLISCQSLHRKPASPILGTVSPQNPVVISLALSNIGKHSTWTWKQFGNLESVGCNLSSSSRAACTQSGSQ